MKELYVLIIINVIKIKNFKIIVFPNVLPFNYYSPVNFFLKN